MAWHQAVGSKKLDVHCAPQGESAAGIVIFCTYDSHSLRSDEIGFGPYAGYSEFTIRDGKIGPAESDITESASASVLLRDGGDLPLVDVSEPPRRRGSDV